MVSGSKSTVWSSDLPSCILKPIKGLLFINLACVPIALSVAHSLERSLHVQDVCLKRVSAGELRTKRYPIHTDVKKNSTIVALVNDMVLENFVIQCSRFFVGRRHLEVGVEELRISWFGLPAIHCPQWIILFKSSRAPFGLPFRSRSL